MAGNYNLGTAEGTIRINYDGAGSRKAQEDFDKTEQSAKKSQKSFSDLSNQAAVAGGILAAGLGYATTKAIDFEKQISAIGAVSGASKADLEALRQKALQLGADTSFSASEAAQAMEELAKAGVSTKDILNGAADATVALAAAGGVDLPEAAAIAANSMNQFGITAQELPHVVDLIAGAANNSAIDVKDFGLSIAQSGAVAHLAGLSFQDTALAITAMGNAGIKGSDAGTSLKTFLQNLIPTTKEQIALSQQLGLITKDGSNAFFDQAGKLKSLADISQILQNSLKGMSKEQQLAALQTLFGSDAIRAAAVIAGEGKQGFDGLATSLGKVSAADVAAQRLDNTAGKIEQLKGSAETAAISVGDALLPQLLNMVNTLTKAANWFNALDANQKKAIISVVQITASILLAVAAMGKIVKMIETVKAFVAILKAWEIAQKLSAVATGIMTAAQWAWNAALAVNPVVLIVIAIIALVAAIYLLWTRSSAFRNFFIGLWNSIWGLLKAIGAWFAGPFADFFVGLWNKIWPFIQAVGNAFKALWDGLVANVKWAWGIVSGILGFFAPLFRAVFGLIVDIVKTAWSVISAIFQVSYTVWSAIFNAIWAVLSAIWNAMWNAFVGTVRWVWGIIGPIITGAWNATMGLLQAGLNLLRAAWDFIWEHSVATLRWAWGIIGPFVQSSIQFIWGIISAVLNFISTAWTMTWNAISAVASAVWNFIVAVIRSAMNDIITVINGFRSMLAKVREFFDSLKNAASGGVGSLIAFVAGIPGKILGALGDLGSKMWNAGVSIIQSFIDGIKHMAGVVYDTVSGIVGRVRNLLPFSPAKEGPLSGRGYTLYSGQAFAAAFAEGIRAKADEAVQATLSLTQQVSATAQATNPLTQQYSLQGGVPSITAPAPRVSVSPEIKVYAVLGDEVKEVVKTTVEEETALVASSANEGNQKRTFLAPGRAL